MSTKTLLSDEIERGFEKIANLEVGSEEHTKAVKELNELMDREIEYEKIGNDVEDKTQNRKVDKELRLKQMEYDQKDRLVKNCLTGFSFATGVGLTIWGALKSWKFEETGTITSSAGRKFINSLFFKK